MFLNRFLPHIGASSLALYNNPGSTVPKRSGTLYFLPTFSKLPASMESSGNSLTRKMPYFVYVPSEFGETKRMKNNMATFFDTAISLKEMGL